MSLDEFRNQLLLIEKECFMHNMKQYDKECPEDCGADPWIPKIDPNCNCGKPLMISIPAGLHIHPCKVHHHVILRGSEIYC